MPSDGSVTRWIGRLQAGDPVAAQKLWERYFRRLVGLARRKLQDAPRRAADEEDVALSAFASFCLHAAHGRFPQLADRDNLWQLLVTLTARKAHHLHRDETRQKRGGGKVQSASPEHDFDEMIHHGPSPADAALVAEECRRLLEALGEEDLRAVALWKLEGHTNEEIARKLGCVRLTVQRKLRLIRDLWAKEVDS
jgi:DNA-directed RNA polymerase specialized sigma24 family protein